MIPSSATEMRSFFYGDPSYDEVHNVELSWQSKAQRNAALKEFLKVALKEIRKEIAELQKIGVSSQKIHMRTKELLDQFQKDACAIEKNEIVYERDKQAILKNYRVVAANIESARPNFSSFTKKSLPQEQEIGLDQRKIAMARCIQNEEGSQSYCVPALMKGLSREEVNEVSDAAMKAPVGAAANMVMAPLAAVSKGLEVVTDTVVQAVKPIYTLYTRAAAHHYCAMHSDSPKKCVKHMIDALEGKNPEVNQTVKEAIPNWMVRAGERMAAFDDTCRRIDDLMATTYYSYPGVVKAGAYGAIDVAIGGAASSLTVLGKGAASQARSLLHTAIDARDVRKITKSLSRPLPKELESGALFLDERMKASSSLISRYLSPEDFANTLTFKKQPITLNNVNGILPEVAQGRSGSAVYFLQNAENNLSVVLKDYPGLISTSSAFGQELLAYELLKNLRLTHFELPKIKKVGQWIPEGSDYKKGLMAMSRADGFNIVEMLNEASSLSFANVARDKKISEISFAIEKIGRGLKELHGKNPSIQMAPSSAIMEKEAYRLANWFQAAEDKGFLFAFDKRELDGIIAHFHQNPGQARFTHGDAHLQNFIWNPESSSLTAIDVGSFARFLDPHLNPISLPAKDLAEMSVTLGYFSRQVGLSETEISFLKQSFWKGYENELNQVFHTAESLDFFDCYWNLFVLNFNPKREKDISKYVDSINRLLEKKAH